MWSLSRASPRARTTHTPRLIRIVVSAVDDSSFIHGARSLMGRPASPADISGVDSCGAIGLRLGFERFFEHFVVGGYHHEVGFGYVQLDFEVGSGFVGFA
jgi:hypothetical protein